MTAFLHTSPAHLLFAETPLQLHIMNTDSDFDPDFLYDVDKYEETIAVKFSFNIKNVLQEYNENTLQLKKNVYVNTNTRGNIRGMLVVFDNNRNGKGLDIYMNKIDICDFQITTFRVYLGRDGSPKQEISDVPSRYAVFKVTFDY